MAAAFGFRYQYLITVEVLLDLYASGSSDWSVDVDPVSQDSADIVVRLTAGNRAERALQVKASLPNSSTTIGTETVRRLLDRLSREHKGAHHREIITNRAQTAHLTKELRNPNSTLLKPGEHFVSRSESSQKLIEKLLHTIGKLRIARAGGTGRELHYLLLRQLLDRVHEAGADTHNQSLAYEDVRRILEGANSLFSEALGKREWGKCIQVPTGDFIDRQESKSFLEKQLPANSLYKGVPRIAVLKGLSGTGKSAAAYMHARSLLEHVAFVLWLDASSSEVLESQIPMIFEDLGVRWAPIGTPAQDFVELLSGLPVPWVLVLDGASSPEAVDAWIPRSGYGQVLLTTRVATWPDSFAPTLSMDAFSETEARLFVEHRLRQPVKSWSPEQLSACDTISRSLARWPLAMEVAIGWIARHGSSVMAMQRFAERIDRLNLDDENLLPHGYPQTAAHVILSQWTELSREAQLLASSLLAMGGKHVPGRILLDALLRQKISKATLEELLASGLVRQEIVTSGQPHDLDEVITIHGFVQLIMEKRGIPLDTWTVWDLMRICDECVGRLTNEGRFDAGAAMVRPVDHFLKWIVEAFKENPEVLVLFSPLMHNLAQLAFITSQAAIARLWSRVAFNVRRLQSKPPQDHSAWVQMQLQTLSLVAITAARADNLEEVVEVGHLVGPILQQCDQHTLRDPTTLPALRMLRDVLQLHLPDTYSPLAHDVLQQLNSLIPQGDPQPRITGAGSVLIRRLQVEAATAIQIAERSAWQAGVDTIIGAANHALEHGVLVDQVIDGMLHVGLVLMVEATKRPLETPELLIKSVKRLVVWLDENSAALDADQRIRYSILSAFVKDTPGALADAVQSLPLPDKRTLELDVWVQLSISLNEQREAMRRRQIFSDPSPSIVITHSIDGGDQLNIWWRGSEPSPPELWVHAPGIITVSSLGRTDPVREGMERSGLQELDQERPPPAADGWSARLSGAEIEISDAEGTTWVSVEQIPEEITKRIIEHKGLVLVYGDLPVTPPTARRLSGWVPLSSYKNQPNRRNDDDPQDRSARWWHRLVFWRP